MTERPTSQPPPQAGHSTASLPSLQNERKARRKRHRPVFDKVTTERIVLTGREQAAYRPAGPGEPSPHPSNLEAPAATPYMGLDRTFKAGLARLTLGIAPAALARAYFGWLTDLMLAPGKQLQLIEAAAWQAVRFWMYAANAVADPDTPPCVTPQPQDHRFNDESWRRWPYNLIYQSFLLTQQWWQNATTGIDGLSSRSQEAVSFITRQLLDIVSPSNFPWTNPEIARVTLEQGGFNLLRGARNAWADWQRFVSRKPPEGTDQFQVGKNLAVTPGKVVYENRLIELIQYGVVEEVASISALRSDRSFYGAHAKTSPPARSEERE